MKFSDRIQTKKGEFAESIIDKKLIDRGWIIYKPINDAAHAFDRLCIKDKKICMVGEVKAKAKRKYFPDTGIDYRHYLDYKRMFEIHALDTFLFFVDEEAFKIYGNYLSILDKPKEFVCNNKQITYPKVEHKQKSIIYFHISLMIDIATLEKEEIDYLSKFTSKNELYLPDS